MLFWRQPLGLFQPCLWLVWCFGAVDFIPRGGMTLTHSSYERLLAVWFRDDADGHTNGIIHILYCRRECIDGNAASKSRNTSSRFSHHGCHCRTIQGSHALPSNWPTRILEDDIGPTNCVAWPGSPYYADFGFINPPGEWSCYYLKRPVNWGRSVGFQADVSAWPSDAARWRGLQRVHDLQIILSAYGGTHSIVFWGLAEVTFVSRLFAWAPEIGLARQHSRSWTVEPIEGHRPGTWRLILPDSFPDLLWSLVTVDETRWLSGAAVFHLAFLGMAVCLSAQSRAHRWAAHAGTDWPANEDEGVPGKRGSERISRPRQRHQVPGDLPWKDCRALAHSSSRATDRPRARTRRCMGLHRRSPFSGGSVGAEGAWACAMLQDWANNKGVSWRVFGPGRLKRDGCPTASLFPFPSLCRMDTHRWTHSFVQSTAHSNLLQSTGTP